MGRKQKLAIQQRQNKGREKLSLKRAPPSCTVSRALDDDLADYLANLKAFASSEEEGEASPHRHCLESFARTSLQGHQDAGAFLDGLTDDGSDECDSSSTTSSGSVVSDGGGASRNWPMQSNAQATISGLTTAELEALYPVQVAPRLKAPPSGRTAKGPGSTGRRRLLPGEKKKLRQEGIKAKRARRDAVDVLGINQQLRALVVDELDMEVFSVGKHGAKVVCKMAACYGLKASYQGTGKKKAVVVLLTRYSALPHGGQEPQLQDIMQQEIQRQKTGLKGVSPQPRSRKGMDANVRATAPPTVNSANAAAPAARVSRVKFVAGGVLEEGGKPGITEAVSSTGGATPIVLSNMEAPVTTAARRTDAPPAALLTVQHTADAGDDKSQDNDTLQKGFVGIGWQAAELCKDSGTGVTGSLQSTTGLQDPSTSAVQATCSSDETAQHTEGICNVRQQAAGSISASDDVLAAVVCAVAEERTARASLHSTTAAVCSQQESLLDTQQQQQAPPCSPGLSMTSAQRDSGAVVYVGASNAGRLLALGMAVGLGTDVFKQHPDNCFDAAEASPSVLRPRPNAQERRRERKAQLRAALAASSAPPSINIAAGTLDQAALQGAGVRDDATEPSPADHTAVMTTAYGEQAVGGIGLGYSGVETGAALDCSQFTDIGYFERHTTGFGSRMLAKWGFKEGQGLGKNADGRKEPVESIMRPKRLGLGA